MDFLNSKDDDYMVLESRGNKIKELSYLEVNVKNFSPYISKLENYFLNDSNNFIRKLFEGNINLLFDYRVYAELLESEFGIEKKLENFYMSKLKMENFSIKLSYRVSYIFIVFI